MAESLREISATPPSSERISQDHFISTKARGKYELPPRFGKFTDSNNNPISVGDAASTRINLPGSGWRPNTGG